MTKSRGNPPQIQREKCTGCGLCLMACPSFVIDWREDKAEVQRGEWCIGCGHCGAVCPPEAILPASGTWEKPWSEKADLTLSPEALQGLLRSRRSIRNYAPDPVPKEVLERILEAGRYAPTGSNSQNVHYLVLTASEEIQKLKEMTLAFYERLFAWARGRWSHVLLSLWAGRKTVDYLRRTLPKVQYAYGRMQEGRDILFYHAPALILTHAESWDSSSPFNCAVALYHASLMAHSLGLGCCFNGFLVNAVNHEKKIKRWLKIPGDHRCYAAMTLGYPKVKYLRGVPRESPKVTWR
jgi:nitroreductase/Pyruvate/2-oxoacid:ferredoxin oxidoreductase delta subunit